MQGGRFGWFMDYNQDNPTLPFVVYNRDGNRVVIPAGQYDWLQHAFEYQHNPSAPLSFTARYRIGDYYDGDFQSHRADQRLPPRLAVQRHRRLDPHRTSTCRTGTFVTDLIPVRATYNFTPLASLQALVQYNGQTGAVLGQRAAGAAQPQRHRPVRGLQRPPRHHQLHADRDAGPLVRDQVHAAVRSVTHQPAPTLHRAHSIAGVGPCAVRHRRVRAFRLCVGQRFSSAWRQLERAAVGPGSQNASQGWRDGARR